MTIELVEGERRNFFSKMRTLLHKRSSDNPDRASLKREEFIALLQKRYGYTREKAEAEMDAHYSEIILA